MKPDITSDLPLLPPLPEGDFIDPPPEIDRFTVQIFPNGTMAFKGPRARIEEFLQACAEHGLILEVDYTSLCG